MRFSWNSPNGRAEGQTLEPERPAPGFAESESPRGLLQTPKLLEAKVRLHHRLIDELNLSHIDKIQRSELRLQVQDLISEYVASERIPLNARELSEFVDELTGLGPIEPILKDPTVTDILINTHEHVYVERNGLLEPAPVRFRDEAHVLRIVNKIVGAVGRRVDESSPMVDARLLDGSRINVAVRPIAIDGPLVSIRKFAKRTLEMDTLVKSGSLSATMARVLGEAVRSRVSIVISGGTGSGKTTFLNALSRFIFGSLLQQTEELGTNLTSTLRVFSEDMRARRFFRAEEKAYGLPVKLVLPLALFVFPGMLVVALLPIITRIQKAFF